MLPGARGDATEFSTEQSPKHTYSLPGSFWASVIVTDATGATDQDYYEITVEEPLAEGEISAEQLLLMLPESQRAQIQQALEGASR